MTKRNLWVWLLLQEKLWFDEDQRSHYSVIKQGRAANGEYGPYAVWDLIGVFDTREEAVAMRKLVEG